MQLTMPLNEEINWDSLEDHERDAFQTKISKPEKVKIEAGTTLYKFNGYKALTAPGKNTLSPWWSPYHAYRHDAGYLQKLQIAKANGVSIREWGRVTSAIKENWNSLNYLLVIILNIEVYGFFGGHRQMERKDAGKPSRALSGEMRGAGKNLPGGANQFFIPNLTTEHVNNWRVEDLARR